MRRRRTAAANPVSPPGVLSRLTLILDIAAPTGVGPDAGLVAILILFSVRGCRYDGR